MSSDEPFYWILVPETCLEIAITQTDTTNLLTNTSPFRPRYNKNKNREEVSMCDAELGKISAEEAAMRLNNYQRDTRQTVKKYAAAAKLTDADLQELGFSHQRDDTPYEGHTNAYISGKLDNTENKLIRHLLMDKANHNTIVKINT